MTSPDTLYATLGKDPNDWPTRSVLADCHEEAGRQQAAECVRWMVLARKRPYRAQAGTYHWFNAAEVTTGTDPESDLPAALYSALRGREGYKGLFRDYPTLREADEDLYAAWDAARSRGWTPEA
jgi:hypothetical protein